MAQDQSPSSLISPAQLWVGPHDLMVEEVEKYLQKKFCTYDACNVCTTCEKIRKRQHYAIQWLAPEKNYTLDDLDIIFETTSLALNQDELFFFIVQKSDFLSLACANRLLKILEEPPKGYHFILVAERSSALPSTIRSRCTTNSFFAEHHSLLHEKLSRFFIHPSTNNPVDFLKELEASKINEQESFELLDGIISHWAQHHKKAVQSGDTTQQHFTEKKVALFSKALLCLPMPGSSKIFWKNIFLQSSHQNM